MLAIVVDDNEDLVEFLCCLLDDEGYKTLGFDTPEKALAHIRAHAIRPDLLITDFNLPQMNGYELHLAVRRIAPDVRTLIISGRDVADQAHGLPFLQKPFTPDRLLQTIESLKNAPNPA